MRGLQREVMGFRGLRVHRDGDRVCMAFRWFADPNTYEFCSAVHGGAWAWDAMNESDGISLVEQLDTAFLLRATKTRLGPVLRIDLDTGALREHRDRSFYVSEVLDHVRHLRKVGLHTRPGKAARRAKALLSWTSAAVNSPQGDPRLGQIVTVRDSDEEAQIVHLELTDRARAVVGHELVFTAIHHAARHGIRRLYSPPTLGHIEPFGFTRATGRPGMVVYDITTQDLNWPRTARSWRDRAGHASA